MIETYRYDQNGNPLSRVGLGAAVGVNEGETSFFETFITNATTKGGQPWQADFDIDFTAVYGTPPFEAMMSPISYPATLFGPGERKGPFSGSITPYLGSASRGGVLTVNVSRMGVTVPGGLDNTQIIIVPPVVEYTLGVTIEPPGAGYVFASPSRALYLAGEVVTLTAAHNPGYVFGYWGGWPSYPGMGSTSPSIQITMSADWWVVAVFGAIYVPPPPPPPPPVYTCPTCGATFSSQAEVDAHIVSAHTPTKSYWYRVTFTDGSVSDIAVPYDPGGNISLWDIVDRYSVASFVYLGFY